MKGRTRLPSGGVPNPLYPQHTPSVPTERGLGNKLPKMSLLAQNRINKIFAHDRRTSQSFLNVSEGLGHLIFLEDVLRAFMPVEIVSSLKCRKNAFQDF